MKYRNMDTIDRFLIMDSGVLGSLYESVQNITSIKVDDTLTVHIQLTSWLKKPRVSVQFLQGLSNNLYSEPNQSNSLCCCFVHLDLAL